jgi:hypothetical protein
MKKMVFIVVSKIIFNKCILHIFRVFQLSVWSASLHFQLQQTTDISRDFSLRLSKRLAIPLISNFDIFKERQRTNANHDFYNHFLIWNLWIISEWVLFNANSMRWWWGPLFYWTNALLTSYSDFNSIQVNIPNY